jgi:hypothetical protein
VFGEKVSEVGVLAERVVGLELEQLSRLVDERSWLCR